VPKWAGVVSIDSLKQADDAMEGKMKVVSVPLAVASLLAVLALGGCSAAPEDQAIAELKNLGARIKTEAESGVVSVDLSRTKAHDGDLANLAVFPNLRELNLSDTPIKGPGLEYLAGLHHLETLYLVSTQFEDAGMAHLAHLTSLRTLHLGRTKITSAGMPALRGLTQLRTKTTPAGIQELRRSLPNTQIERN
jgi:hypothetical protein